MNAKAGKTARGLPRTCPGDCLAGAADCPLFSENWSGELHRNESLASLTTFRVGGPAAVMARPASLAELAALLVILERRGCPWRVLGRGSNLLVADRGYAGVVIMLGRRLARIEPLTAEVGEATTREGKNPGSAGAGTAPGDVSDHGGKMVSARRVPQVVVSSGGKRTSVREPARSPQDAAPCDRLPGGSRCLVRVEAGCSLAALLGWAEQQGLGGLEFLAGIPGSVGGAVIMNAGAHGHCLGELVHALDLVAATGVTTAVRREKGADQSCAGVLYRELAGGEPLATAVAEGRRGSTELEQSAHGDKMVSGHRVPQVVVSSGGKRTSVREPARSPQDAVPCDRLRLEFTYRRLQGLVPDEVVGATVLALEPREPGKISAITRRNLERRRAGQPRGVASAGSFFKNPPGDYAGRLIEAAGLKGQRLGDAEVSPVHANFLVNRGAARAADLLALARRVQAAVREHSGVELEPEVHLLGFE